jgi:uncharacterized protein (DUF2235 family)
MKRIVVCCDGTWNDPSKPKQTNVTKLANAIVRRDRPEGDLSAQRVYYVSGVGTAGSIWDRLRGAAVGYGLDSNVQEAYRRIAEDFEPDDHLYLFGFSRGAYTARSTLGMVRKCGIVKDISADTITSAWAFYRNAYHPASDEARAFRAEHAKPLGELDEYVPIARFIGVWDTVGSLGIPIKALQLQYNFHDVTLTSRVDNAYQALAVDEARRDFTPTLWAQSETPRAEQQLEQRWFSGSHSDVGGGAGYEGDDAQSDYCLRWILDHAIKCGLDVDLNAIDWTPAGNDFPRLHIDPGLLYRLWELIRTPLSRPIGKGVLAEQDGNGRPSFETVDSEARRRLRMVPSYKPKNLIAWEADQD